MKKSAIVLFSGGKDCAYSLEEIAKSHKIIHLATSVNEDGCATYTDGLEAPGNILDALSELYKRKLTSEGHGTNIVKVNTSSKKPVEDFYRKIMAIAQRDNITTVVTGDLEHDNGVNKEFEALGCKKLGIEVISPAGDYFKKNGPEKYIIELIRSGLDFIISAVRKGDLSKDYIGKQIKRDSIGEILREFPELDITGEGGEFQTLVLGSKFLGESIEILEFGKSRYGKGRDGKNHLYSRMVDIKYSVLEN
ncbi:hypothetical protein IPJ72_04590 [Candidatus Peregrinibacteria bacterium]|nr:MAG: hypothetical protein IPJ72_04590 [Candidatus Peregrinibacteria bacterium]